MWQEDRHQRIRALLATLERVSTERIMAEPGAIWWIWKHWVNCGACMAA
jgi:hypothetical protein